MVAALSIVLLLISIGTIVGPVAGVAIIYRDDLTQLVITPQIRDIMNGNSTIFPTNNQQNDNGNPNNNDNSGLSGLFNPTLVSAQVDEAARTFTATFSITNGLNYDLTLNSFSANVEITQEHYQAGSISLSSPVAIPAGETSQLTISGQWTQGTQDYIATNYPGATSFDVYLANPTIDVNGITVQIDQPIYVGNVPIQY